MFRNNISRTRRRKRERDALLQEYHAIASQLGLKLVNVHGLRKAVFQDAVDLLNEARSILPPDAIAQVASASPANGIFIAVANVSEIAS